VERVQKEEREQSRLMREFEGRTGVKLEKEKEDEGANSFYKMGKRPKPVELLSMKGPVTTAKRKNVVGMAPQQTLAQNAIVGQWSSASTNDTVATEPEFKRSTADQIQIESGSEPDAASSGDFDTVYNVDSNPSSLQVNKPTATNTDDTNKTDKTDTQEEQIKEPVKIELRKFNKPTNLRK
jgi:hypothetical protein